MRVLAHGSRYIIKQAPDGTLRFWYKPSFEDAREVPTLAEVDEPYRERFVDALRLIGATVVTVKIADLPWIADKIIEKETL